MSSLEASELSLFEREMLIQAIEREPALLKFIADKYKTPQTRKNAVQVSGWTLGYVPNKYKTREMCNKALEENPWFLSDVPDHLKTPEMCKKAVEEDPYTLKFVPDPLKTQKMCERDVEKDPYALEYVSMDLITQEMCNEAVKICPWSLIHVPDHYVRLKEMWREDYSHVVAPEPWGCDDKLIEWRNGHVKRKAQKAEIKEKSVPIAWHPSRWWDWCTPEDE